MNYEACLNCGYDLHNLPEQHKCPECGTAFEIQATRQRWREFLL